MNCWHCERTANGVCKFCGRALCKDHVKMMPYVLNIFRNKAMELKALVVSDVLYCGVCQPKEEPIDIIELDG